MRLGKPGGKGRRWLDSQKEQNKASVVIPLCQGDLHPHLLPPSSASAPRKQAGDAGSPGTDAGCTQNPSSTVGVGFVSHIPGECCRPEGFGQKGSRCAAASAQLNNSAAGQSSVMPHVKLVTKVMISALR